MNDQPGPSGGMVLAAVFLILAGLCLVLLGGGCTFIFLSEFNSVAGSGGTAYLPIFILALIVLGGGIAMIWLGVKLLRGGFTRP